MEYRTKASICILYEIFKNVPIKNHFQIYKISTIDYELVSLF